METGKLIAILLVGVSLALTAIGGLEDMRQNQYRITKEHAWRDGLFLLVLALVVLEIYD